MVRCGATRGYPRFGAVCRGLPRSGLHEVHLGSHGRASLGSEACGFGLGGLSVVGAFLEIDAVALALEFGVADGRQGVEEGD